MLTEKPENSSPLHVAVVDAPWPQCLPVHLGTNPKVGVDVVSPNKLDGIGTEVIIELRVSVNSACLTSSTGWYTDATNIVM